MEEDRHGLETRNLFVCIRVNPWLGRIFQHSAPHRKPESLALRHFRLRDKGRVAFAADIGRCSGWVTLMILRVGAERLVETLRA